MNAKLHWAAVLSLVSVVLAAQCVINRASQSSIRPSEALPLGTSFPDVASLERALRMDASCEELECGWPPFYGSDRYRVLQSLEQLAKGGDKRALATLVRALRSNCTDLQTWAVDAVEAAGPLAPLEEFVTALKTGRDINVRLRAALALGNLGSEEHVPVLAAALLHDEDAVVRSRTAIALGRLRSPSAIPYLRESCRVESPIYDRYGGVCTTAYPESAAALKALGYELTKEDEANNEVMKSIGRQILELQKDSSPTAPERE